MQKLKNHIKSYNPYVLHKKLQVHYVAILLLGAWCIPYITSGNRIELGDFSFFSQAYEAVRISILEYGQFPWWNPWVAGGVPLYANPQIGVFSIQTPFVLLFGTIAGLKISAIIYTFLGYFSMFVLASKYFKIPKFLSSLLSLIWVFSSFFVSHLPSHYTFFWFLLAPFYIYKSLTIKTKRDGIVFGLFYSFMALSMVHNAFFHISVICGAILVVRLASSRSKALLLSILTFVATTLIIAGHRIIMTLENVADFPRVIVDNASSIGASILSPLLPYIRDLNVGFFRYPGAPWGWGEQTASLGLSILFLSLLLILFILFRFWENRKILLVLKSYSVPLTLLGLGAIFFVVGMGSFSEWSPYSLLKKLPIFSETRVSPRWFIWLNLCVLLFIGTIYRILPKSQKFIRFSVVIISIVGVVELFTYNYGYQHTVLNREVVVAPEDTSDYSFVQQNLFGETRDIFSKNYDIDSTVQQGGFYREFEATTFNIGVLRANDALADLNTKATPRCSWVENCGFILTNNAVLESWSPNGFTIKRTGAGKIMLNVNSSSYYIVNGERIKNVNVSEPYRDFIIEEDGADLYVFRISPDNSPLHIFRTLVSSL